MKKISKLAIGATLLLASVSVGISVKADTVQARCDVYPKGEDRATSSGPCTFSQRQGVVGIQLENGQRYDLIPEGDQPGNYLDPNGQAAYREGGLGDAGQIYRLATESIFVYWDAAPYETSEDSDSSSQSTDSETITPAESTDMALVGETVEGLSDLVSARAGQAETQITDRGYEYVRGEQGLDNTSFSYWREPESGLCILISTKEGRYDSIVYANVEDQTECR